MIFAILPSQLNPSLRLVTWSYFLVTLVTVSYFLGIDNEGTLSSYNYYQIISTNLTEYRMIVNIKCKHVGRNHKICSCQDWLDKQGFWKRDTAREWETRHENSEKSEDQGTDTAPWWRCQNWIQARFIILSAVNERTCGELNYNSCGLQDQRTKWSLII